MLAIAVAATGVSSGSARASGDDDDHDHHGRNAFRQVNLVSDLASVHPLLVDEEVKNPWGIAFGPHTPLWVSNNFNPALAELCPDCPPTPEDVLTKVTVYSGANGHDPFVKVPLEVTASFPTGIVFNPTKKFVIEQGGVRAPANFLFNEAVPNADGTVLAEVTGWSNASTPVPTTTAITKAHADGVFYFGLAVVPAKSDDESDDDDSDDSGKSGGSDDSRRSHKHAESGALLVAVGSTADEAATGHVDVFDGSFNKLDLPGAFVDPHSQDLAPYNVAYLNGRVYIAYTTTVPDNGGPDAVSVFSRSGRFLKRLVTGDHLAGPWGMAIAPEDWGGFGGALLVGNVGDGMINAFNPRNGHFRGTISDAKGEPLVNPGLWGLAFGNGTIGTHNTLLFAAGIGELPGGFGEEVYAHGLVGLIKPIGHDDDDDDDD